MTAPRIFCPECGHRLATGHYPDCTRCPSDRLTDRSCTCGADPHLLTCASVLG